MIPALKKDDLYLKTDEKYKTLDDVVKSPLKSPLKKIEKIHTKIGDIRFLFFFFSFSLDFLD